MENNQDEIVCASCQEVVEPEDLMNDHHIKCGGDAR